MFRLINVNLFVVVFFFQPKLPNNFQIVLSRIYSAENKENAKLFINIYLTVWNE